MELTEMLLHNLTELTDSIRLFCRLSRELCDPC